MDLHIFAFILLIIFTIEIVFVFIMGASKITGRPDLTFTGPPPSVFPRPPPMPSSSYGSGYGSSYGSRYGSGYGSRYGHNSRSSSGHGHNSRSSSGHGHNSRSSKNSNKLNWIQFTVGSKVIDKITFDNSNSNSNVIKIDHDFSKLLNTNTFKSIDDVLIEYNPSNLSIKCTLGSIDVGTYTKSPITLSTISDIRNEVAKKSDNILKLTLEYNN